MNQICTAWRGAEVELFARWITSSATCRSWNQTWEDCRGCRSGRQELCPRAVEAAECWMTWTGCGSELFSPAGIATGVILLCAWSPRVVGSVRARTLFNMSEHGFLADPSPPCVRGFQGSWACCHGEWHRQSRRASCGETGEVHAVLPREATAGGVCERAARRRARGRSGAADQPQARMSDRA